MKRFISLTLLLPGLFISATAQHKADDIIGRWMSTNNNVEVEVFKCGNEYKARVLWFDDSDDKTKPMTVRCDTRNPDQSMRNRKIIGLEIMHSLVYNINADEWQGGRIYDASSGKDWDAKAWFTNDGCLKVRGFWHFEFLGRNICFKKVS
ncbi:MAG TPA: DUF2147 domain-containing protein [Chitinophagaceae bacterium]|nr:DUF2147 domain-containing protein [Chitinophagaceae bacterium]